MLLLMVRWMPPDTLGKMLGKEKYEKLREDLVKDKDGLILPEKRTARYLELVQQHRSTWNHEIDYRVYTDQPW